MRLLSNLTILAALCLHFKVSDAFYVSGRQRMRIASLSKLGSTPDNNNIGPPSMEKQSQIAKLSSMAAKLRAEAAELEVEQQRVFSEKLSETFKLFDPNNDGSISVEELKNALALQLQATITEEQALKIMKRFDSNGDGSIQLEEFKGIDAFRNSLEAILQEEKTAVIEATQQAILAKKNSEAAIDMSNAVQEQVNSLPPSNADKLVSLIPYLLPLADVIPYSKAFIVGNNLELSNPIFEFGAFVFLIYQTVPFSGLVAFFALNALTNNLKLNRLVRFNMQQAIFFDIALIFPNLLGTVSTIAAKQGGFEIPSAVVDAGATATFMTISAGIIYSMGSSLIGVIPDKVPIISERVKRRVPNAEDVLKKLEEQDSEWLPGADGKPKNRNRPEKKPKVEQIEDSDEKQDEDKK